MTRKENTIMEPPYLNNQEIIGLLFACFEYHLIVAPALGKANVTIYVRRADGVTGFDFWISLKFGERKENYKGAVFGTDHEVFISEGQREDHTPYPVGSWNYDFSVPVVRVYRYLESIYYFSRMRPPQENQSLLAGGVWNPIFHRNWPEDECAL